MEKEIQGRQPQETNPEEEPVIYAVSKTAGGLQFTRRNFIEMAAASAAVAVVSGCGGNDNVQEVVAGATDAPVPTNTSAPTETSLPPSATNAPTSTSASTSIATDAPTSTLQPTEMLAATAAPVPQVTVSQASVNVRRGPGTVHPVLTIAYEGESFPVIGRIRDGSWFEIMLEDDLRGWIATSVVTFTFLVDSIPLALNIPTPPAEQSTQEPTAAPPPTEQPTQEPTPVPQPPEGSIPGPAPDDQDGIEFSIDGQIYHLPCGSPLPAGFTCTCNCVAGSPGDTICTCDVVTYWYPN